MVKNKRDSFYIFLGGSLSHNSNTERSWFTLWSTNDFLGKIKLQSISLPLSLFSGQVKISMYK